MHIHSYILIPSLASKTVKCLSNICIKSVNNTLFLEEYAVYGRKGFIDKKLSYS